MIAKENPCLVIPTLYKIDVVDVLEEDRRIVYLALEFYQHHHFFHGPIIKRVLPVLTQKKKLGY